MTEAKWLAGPHLDRMIDYLDEKGGYGRRLRLFACACLRRAWTLLRVEAARRIVELSEAYADGEATDADLQAANGSPDFADLDALNGEGHGDVEVQLSACVVDALQSARCLASPDDRIDCNLIVQDTSRDSAKDFLRSSRNYQMGRSLGRDDVEFAAKKKILRDIFGNPFRTVRFDRSRLTPTIASIAQAAYEGRELPAGHLDPARLAVLSDAIEEAGCTDTEILSHLRSPGPHVRGCWVVDLLLGKSDRTPRPTDRRQERP
jgi:hypothetical protein